MESWMVNIFIALVGVIGTYAVLRSRVTRLESDYQQHIQDSDKAVVKIHERIDAGFKRLDYVSEKTVILERDTANLLTLETAEKKFVTRVELGLHLEKIEIITGNTNKEVTLLMGKQDEILDILRNKK